MIYQMKLHDKPFQLIKNRKKIIEMRLNDEKRSKLKIGDNIEFENRDSMEHITTLIEDIQVYSDFNTLYKNYSKEELGYLPDEVARPEDMNKYYTKEEQDKYGGMAIQIKLDNYNLN